MWRPKIRAYLSELRRRLVSMSFQGSILVMGSHGGVLPPEAASEQAAITCLSGPAGGVIATVNVAADLGIADAISFDMGGTSTDVSLVRGGRRDVDAIRDLGPADLAAADPH